MTQDEGGADQQVLGVGLIAPPLIPDLPTQCQRCPNPISLLASFPQKYAILEEEKLRNREILFEGMNIE